MQTGKAIVLAGAVGILGCQAPTEPTPPTNITITQNQGSNQNNNGGGNSNPSCDGLVGQVSLGVIGGTFSGGKGKVGEPLLLQLSVGAVGGGGIPQVCLGAAPVVTPAGTCDVPQGITQKLDRITVVPSRAGLCVVAATFGGKSDSVTVDVIP